MGSQNWTDDLAPVFRARYGYDPLPWLPVLTGRVVGQCGPIEPLPVGLAATGGRSRGDRVCGWAARFVSSAGAAVVAGELWPLGVPGRVPAIRRAIRTASAANSGSAAGSARSNAGPRLRRPTTYGLPRVSAEAFTGGPLFQTVPSALKARGDWAFCEGINHFVLHVNIHQPWEDRLPGVNAWFGTEFNRHNTWFEASRDWITYLRRCCHLLQQGTRVADIAYFIGEDAPKMTGVRKPDLPPGCDFDYINAEVIQTRLTVKDGLLTLPGGPAYRVLVLPAMTTMRPELLRKIRDLVLAGATIWGAPPACSPSLQHYPHCDREVRTLAAEIWGEEKEAVLVCRQATEGVVRKRVLTPFSFAVDFSSTRAIALHAPEHQRCGDLLCDEPAPAGSGDQRGVPSAGHGSGAVVA